MCIRDSVNSERAVPKNNKISKVWATVSQTIASQNGLDRVVVSYHYYSNLTLGRVEKEERGKSVTEREIVD